MADGPETPPTPAPAPRRRRRRVLRPLLLALGPLAVLAGGTWLYAIGGRTVSTDDAYVKAGKVQVSAEVGGRIAGVAVRENEHVARGDLLVRIDPAPYRIALARCQARRAGVRADLASLVASYHEKREQMRLAKTTAAFQAREYQRQSDLAKKHMAAPAQVDAARHARDVAEQQIGVLRTQLDEIVARLDGEPDAPLASHAAYREASAACDAAALDLKRTEVRAPVPGVVSHVPEPGNHVDAGAAVMGIVREDHVWIEANFKETELTHLEPGQPATIHVDTYPDIAWHGHVESISQATGAEFSLLPPQNATGNWVKVVQRVPVRIAIDATPDAPPLRAGMSTTVEVATGYRRPLPRVLADVLAHLAAAG